MFQSDATAAASHTRMKSSEQAGPKYSVPFFILSRHTLAIDEHERSEYVLIIMSHTKEINRLKNQVASRLSLKQP